METAGRRTELGDMLVTARPLDEYLAMFVLGRDDVAGRRILDCPGGAASFTAEASDLGAEATAVDPIYDRDVEDLVARRRVSGG
jgi:predicted RNA methylase